MSPAMLDRLIPPDARARLRALAARLPVLERTPAPVAPPTSLPDFGTPPAPMVPLRPPEAINDNPLRSIEEAVERELRARGHLR